MRSIVPRTWAIPALAAFLLQQLRQRLTPMSSPPRRLLRRCRPSVRESMS